MKQPTPASRSISIIPAQDYCIGQFRAMNNPCEILVDSTNQSLCHTLSQLAAKEAHRIEDKFSRYRNNNVCSAINNSGGKPLAIDDETHQLLLFASQCYQLSNGLFDLSSGVLGQLWCFDGHEKSTSELPSQTQIEQLLPFIGWDKVHYSSQHITLPAGMQIDFGGIGKEYAVDKVAEQLRRAAPKTSVVVNFGGDLALTTGKARGAPWRIGIENQQTLKPIMLTQGALATSGDSTQFFTYNQQRYCHIINPKTGWPITNAPHSVTVAAPQCIQAGILATLALLHGQDANAFLQAQGVKFYCVGSNT